MLRKLIYVKNGSKIELIEVTESDYEFLYELLKTRKSSANISHKKLPTYEEHVRFVDKNPYKKWYIVKNNKQKIGSIYLSFKDEIGIFIKKEFQRLGFGREAIKLLMKKNSRTRFLANVAPNNIKHQKFFKKIGFTGLQYTYEIINSDIK